jgi:anhydro-N-acetylmuramic acid kinase
MNQQEYRVIGLMSGTSLDGLDIAVVQFAKAAQNWQYKIEATHFIAYDDEMRMKLSQAHESSKKEFSELDAFYGEWLGKQVNRFITEKNIAKVDLISSHGHTVHHQPEKRISEQIGNGPELFKVSGIPVVCDFRLQDVLLGGQGAPLVPIGDLLLFGIYDVCLNLGGFANISFEKDNERLAFDICPVNIVLNALCSDLNLPFDDGGEIARSGQLIEPLFNQLNNLTFYTHRPPKSLGREWVEQNIWPLTSVNMSKKDLLHTFTEHVAEQISRTLSDINCSTVLATGGGAFNTYLIERIKHKSGIDIIIPTSELINYKEALVFALLGVLRWRGETNCLASVTGAPTNHSSGRIFKM